MPLHARLLLLCFLACCQSCIKIPTYPPQLRSISALTDTIVISPDKPAVLLFSIEDKDVLFNYAVETADCQIVLRIAGNTKTPENYTLTDIEPSTKKGEWIAYVEDNGKTLYYEETIQLCFIPSNTAYNRQPVLSNKISVSSLHSRMGIRNFRFTKAINPQLSADFAPQSVSNASDTLYFKDHTPCYVPSMVLIPSFDCRSTVTVNGQVQQSGVTAQDFSRPIVYRVQDASSDAWIYQVELDRFTGLPVIIINTTDGRKVDSREEWIGGTFQLDGMEQFADIPEMGMEIRGRGNSTWRWPKKPFALKLSDKKPLFGFPSHKRWVLLANYMDRTMLRNYMAFTAGSLTSLVWTPRCQFAEVILNGKHLGNYLITEQIKDDSNRVNVNEDGDYLLELDFHYDNIVQWTSAWGSSAEMGHKIPFGIKYPEDDKISIAQIDWIKAYIDTVGRVLYSPTFLDAESGYKQYIDLQSFVDYWLIYELCINHELANPGSVYMWKNRNSKLHAGPLWDFDYGTFSYFFSPDAEGKLFMTEAIWYEQLTKDPEFRALAKQRWKALKGSLHTLPTTLLSESERLTLSAKYNFKMWNPNTGRLINGDENYTFQEAVDLMYSILTERLADIEVELDKW